MNISPSADISPTNHQKSCKYKGYKSALLLALKEVIACNCLYLCNKKDQQQSPKPVNYALTQRFSHASHGTRQVPYVQYTGVSPTATANTCTLEAGTCAMDDSGFGGQLA